MSRKPQLVTMQSYVTKPVRERAKVVAKLKNKTLTEFILTLFANAGDKELKQLAEQAEQAGIDVQIK